MLLMSYCFMALCTSVSDSGLLWLQPEGHFPPAGPALAGEWLRRIFCISSGCNSYSSVFNTDLSKVCWVIAAEIQCVLYLI